MIRIIPFNKPLPPENEWEATTWKGVSSARWDGNTLVIESVDFTDVLLQPWVQNAWYMRLKSKDPVGEPKETLPCGDHSFQHFDPEKGPTKERG